MIKGKVKLCPKCGREWHYSVAVKARLKKYGETKIQCLGCKEWFDIKPEVKIDRRRKEYKDIYVCEDNL